jgi:DNA-binding CsgD family transcriptional regulator
VRGHLAVAAGDEATAVSEFAAAAEGLGTLGFRFDRARCLVHGGLAARRGRRAREAKDLLTEAVAELEVLGSPGWRDRADAELAQVGGRPSSSGLTPTEQRVALLVAEGRRNRDVAKALFVTESAVEATLSRVYAKLGIRSRTELAARLRRTDKR